MFLKNRKVAGTSMEFFLSAFCGGEDVITPIGEEAKFLPQSLQAEFGRKIRFQNYRAFFNHFSGVKARDMLGPDLWSQYFTFTFERDPLSKVRSLFYFNTADVTGDGDPVADFLDTVYPDYLSDASRYIANDRIIVDYVGNYGRLTEDFATICRRLELPFRDEIGYHAKAWQAAGRKEFTIGPTLRHEIADAFALEARHLPWMAVEGTRPSSNAALPWCEARAARQNGRLDDAHRTIERSLRSDPAFWPAHRERAMILWHLGTRQEALEQMSRLVSDQPERVAYLLDLAMMQQGTGDRHNAEQSFRRAVEMSPGSPRVRIRLARHLAGSGSPAEAISQLRKAMSLLREGSPGWTACHIRCLCWEGRTRKAKAYIDENYVSQSADGEIVVPPGRISYRHRVELMRIVGNQELKAGHFRRAVDTLADDDLVDHYGGATVVKLVDRLNRKQMRGKAKAVVSSVLGRNAWSPEFLDRAGSCLAPGDVPPASRQKCIDVSDGAAPDS